MRKLIAIMFSFCLCLVALPALPALAADQEPSNVTITVVMPDPQPAQAEEPATGGKPATVGDIIVYPSDVTEIRDGNEWQIIKTYELSANERPEDIPRDTFERGGWTFSLTDIIRRETANAETRGYTETVTLETETKELEQILPLLAPTMEYKDDDGFIGILSLDVSSITVETAGTNTSSYTMRVTREYPHLSSNDTSLIPKTVEDRGKTYTLASVDWRAGNTVTVDYSALPEYYTAVATYTATGTSTRVTGYITTAEYSGTLARLSQGKTVYTAFFLGEQIRTPLEMAEPAPETAPMPEHTPPPDEPAEEAEEPGAGQDEMPLEESEEGGEKSKNLALLAAIPCLAVMAGGAYYFIKKRKGKPNNEETDNPPADAGDDVGDGSTGSGG